MKRSIQFIVLSTLFLIPASVWAHPGHGDTEGFTITHYFTEPVHAYSLMAIVLVGGVLYFYKRNQIKQTRRVE